MGLQLKRAIRIVLQTKPYIVYRCLVYGGLCLGCILYLIMLAIIGVVFGAGAFWVLLGLSAGLGALLGVGGFISEYIFYRLKAGHLALITEVLSEGRFPAGISQTKWARGHVLHFFKGVSLLADVRQLLRGALRTINRSQFNASTVLPVPGIEGGIKCARRVVDFSQGYIEESAIAYVFRTRNENVYETVKKALLVYCQTWDIMLGGSVTLTLLSYAFALVSTVVFLTPLGVLAVHMPANWTIARFVLFASGVFLGFSAKWAIFDPVAAAATTIALFEESELASEGPAWEARLEAASPTFQELRARAERWEQKHEAPAESDEADLVVLDKD